jgi:hypothetical protein
VCQFICVGVYGVAHACVRGYALHGTRRLKRVTTHESRPFAANVACVCVCVCMYAICMRLCVYMYSVASINCEMIHKVLPDVLSLIEDKSSSVYLFPVFTSHPASAIQPMTLSLAHQHMHMFVRVYIMLCDRGSVACICDSMCLRFRSLSRHETHGWIISRWSLIGSGALGCLLTAAVAPCTSASHSACMV